MAYDSLRFRVAAALVSGAVALTLAEVAIRIGFPHVRDSALPEGLLAISDDLGWSLRPSKTARHRTRYFDVEYRINSMGFRDGPHARASVNRPYRIVLYGDSLVFGWGIPAQTRFSNLLEGEGRSLEMWNHAVPGYGLDQEVLLYEKEGRSLDVDEVMLFVSMSTLPRIHSGKIYAKYKPRFVADADGRLRLVPVPHFRNRVVSMAYRFLSPFYLPYFMQVRLAGAREMSRPPGPRATGDDQQIPRHVGSLELSLLRRAAASARAARHRISLLVANLANEDRAALRAFCADNEVTCLEIDSSLTALMNTDERSGIILGQDDKHWNVRANQLIADSLGVQMTVTHPAETMGRIGRQAGRRRAAGR
jgi:hypothetical protein